MNEITEAMVDAYLTAQRRTVEEADQFGRPNIGGLHTNTVRAATKNGLAAALAVAPAQPTEPLGGKFQRVLDENLRDLYDETTPAEPITSGVADGAVWVRYDLTDSLKEQAIKDRLIALGWTPPTPQADSQPAPAEQPELTVTACYFPGKGEADLTWVRNENGASFGLTVKVTEAQGRALSNVVYPCINWSAAAPQPNTAYAALPDTYYLAGGEVKTWDENHMLAFADATHALRAFHVQAPAVAAVEIHEAKCPALIGDACSCERSDPAVDKAWAQFCAGIGDGPDAPYPGMIVAFERYYGQSFADKDWRDEAAVWAAAWKARDAQPTPTAQGAPDSVLEDAARYRWLAAHCRITSEHWGGRWSIIVDGPAPELENGEYLIDEAIDKARKQGGAA